MGKTKELSLVRKGTIGELDIKRQLSLREE